MTGIGLARVAQGTGLKTHVAHHLLQQMLGEHEQSREHCRSHQHETGRREDVGHPRLISAHRLVNEHCPECRPIAGHRGLAGHLEVPHEVSKPVDSHVGVHGSLNRRSERQTSYSEKERKSELHEELLKVAS